MKPKILIVDDEKILTTALKNFLSKEGYEVAVAEKGETALKMLKNETFDVVLLDLRLPDVNGLTLIPKIKELAPDAGIIIITAYAEVRSAVSAIKEGAFDYLAKPFEEEELLLTIERFLQFKSLRKEVDTLKRRLGQQEALTKFVGESKAVQELLSNIEVVAETDLPVLVLGNQDAGKS
jgi:DNA-binding NtrC family response regulator